MNIFVVDLNPEVAARSLCDKHVVKMPLETAQMLCAVSWRFGLPAQYKPAYVNHPCTLWAGETYTNWKWLIKHGISLCEEYERRFHRQHASHAVIAHCAAHGGHPSSSSSLLTEFAQAMPDKYKQANDAVAAYRAYYVSEKARFALWRKPGKPPVWWPEQEH